MNTEQSLPSTAPRPYHQFVTDKFLPSLYFETPDVFMRELGETREACLRNLWEDSWNEKFGPKVPADDVGVEVQARHDGAQRAALSFPAPTCLCESAMAGVCNRAPQIRLVFNRIRAIRRFFLLTVSETKSHRRVFVLREVVRGGNMINRGMLSELPRVAEFITLMDSLSMFTVETEVWVSNEKGTITCKVAQATARMA